MGHILCVVYHHPDSVCKLHRRQALACVKSFPIGSAIVHVVPEVTPVPNLPLDLAHPRG